MQIFGILILSNPHPVNSRISVGIVGGISSFMAVLSGFATCGYLEYEASATHAILPFIVIGIGLDDMFVIMSGLEEELKQWRGRKIMNKENYALLIGNALGRSGPAIIMTTVT